MKRIRVVNRTCWGQRLNFKKYRHKILTQVTQNFTIFRKYHPTVSYDQPRGSTTANHRRDQFWRTNGRRLFGYGKRGARISPVSGYTDKRGSQEWDGGYWRRVPCVSVVCGVVVVAASSPDPATIMQTCYLCFCSTLLDLFFEVRLLLFVGIFENMFAFCQLFTF